MHRLPLVSWIKWPFSSYAVLQIYYGMFWSELVDYLFKRDLQQEHGSVAAEMDLSVYPYVQDHNPVHQLIVNNTIRMMVVHYPRTVL